MKVKTTEQFKIRFLHPKDGWVIVKGFYKTESKAIAHAAYIKGNIEEARTQPFQIIHETIIFIHKKVNEL